MKDEETRKAVVAEWLSLPPDQRETQQQAFTFAIKAKDRHRIRADGDPYQHVMAWLYPHIGKP